VTAAALAMPTKKGLGGFAGKAAEPGNRGAVFS